MSAWKESLELFKQLEAMGLIKIKNLKTLTYFFKFGSKRYVKELPDANAEWRSTILKDGPVIHSDSVTIKSADPDLRCEGYNGPFILAYLLFFFYGVFVGLVFAGCWYG